MTFTEQQYILTYKVNTFNSIKITKKGKNDNFSWGDSLTVRCTNILTVADEELGLIDKEEIMDFKFECENTQQVSELNLILRSLKSNGVVLDFNGSLPRRFENNPILTVLITDKIDFIIQKYGSMLKKDTKGA